MAPVPLFYASQIFACIGLNQFKPKREALEETWKRLDPSSYYDALSRNCVLSDEQHLELIIKGNTDVKVLVEESVSKQTKTSKETEVTQVMQQAALGTITNLTDAERTLVQKSLKTNVYTGYGTRSEVNVKQVLKESYGCVVLDDSKFHKKTYKTKSGNAFIVGGRIDGFTEDFSTVVEIKNRVKRLFRQVYQYENIQLQSYLEVLNKNQGKLIECYNAKTPEIMIHDVARDRDLWESTIYPGLCIFTDLLLGLIGDESLQDRFMKAKKC